MLDRIRIGTLSACLAGGGACAAVAQPAATEAQLFEGLGSHARAVTTDSEEAQVYFNQALNWMYAFNHDEAIRSFGRAAELDPGCAMAWWGVALCEGPNYNDPLMPPERSERAWNALQRALEELDDETPAERALVEALSFRYEKPWPEDRTHLDKAYAGAMAGVYEQYSDDSDIGTLYADSLMVLTPWMLYELDYTPTANTPTIVAVLEHVMEVDPGNPGAKHLYIHAVEPSADPDRGVKPADELSDMVPGAGHLLHMPSHIYVKTGYWNKAVVQNARALEADARYRELSPEQGIQHMYMTHNAHMLAYAAMMSGREAEAMAAARSMWENIPEDVLPAVAPYVDLWMSSVWDVQKRFGRWDAILAEPAPPSYLPVATATWRAARAIAYAAKKDISSAEAEYEQFKRVKANLPEDQLFGFDNVHRILEVSDYFIAGEIALQQGDYEGAAKLLEKGAIVEDSLSYGEPPQWLQPIRHTLGAVYMKAGEYEQAERVYREDLADWRNNGWSLYGLARALEEQGRTEEATEVMREHERIWQYADEPTQTSCKCIPET
jgi:tetratricopeptide (TPR) repeat protein